MTITDEQINDHAEELLAGIRRNHGDHDALDVAATLHGMADHTANERALNQAEDHPEGLPAGLAEWYSQVCASLRNHAAELTGLSFNSTATSDIAPLAAARRMMSSQDVLEGPLPLRGTHAAHPVPTETVAAVLQALSRRKHASRILTFADHLGGRPHSSLDPRATGLGRWFHRAGDTIGFTVSFEEIQARRG